MTDPLALLGLARKAGRLVLGDAAVDRRLRQGGAVLLLVASDASAHTAQKAKRRAEAANTECLTAPWSKEEFGRAMGRRTCALAVLTDQGFADAIIKSIC